MRFMLVLLAVGGLAACASPAFNMTDAQVRALSDDQLCSFYNGYRSETKTEMEVARRDLNCNRHFRECLRRGNKPETQAMGFCMDLLRENDRLRYERRYHDFDHFGYHGMHRYGGAGVGFGF